jgi:nucleoside-diphosphate-sugar epimerase
MKITILGCGYVGMAVARQWQQQGLEVTATTTTPERLSELATVAAQAVLLRGDDADKLQATLANQHTVLVSVAGGRQRGYAETYLKTAQTLAAVLPQTAVQQVIYTSSFAVYGDHDGAWVTEAMPVKPATPNHEVLATAEQTLLATTTPQRQVCILRLGGIYGPGRELGKIYARAAGTTRPGDGREGSNWIHLDDIVAAIAFAHEHSLSGIYNLVQNEIPTVRDLIERVCQHYNLTPVQWDPSQPSDRAYNVRVSNQKIKDAGYGFVHPRFGF